jgi:putative heme transporter
VTDDGPTIRVIDDESEPGAATLMEDDDPDRAPTRRRLHPMVKLGIGLLVGGAAIWLVVSTAGGVGDALDAVGRMRGGFVALAVAMVALRLGLYGLQLMWLGQRSGRLGAGTALGLALVVYGFGAVTPAAPAEGLALASRELRHRGRSKRQAHLTFGFSEWFAQRTFYAVAAIDLILVIALGHLAFDDSWPLMIAGFVVLLGLGGTALLARRPSSAQRVVALLNAVHIRRPQPSAVRDRRETANEWHAEAMAVVGSPRNRVRLAVVSALAVVADAAALWATCHAAGFHIHPELAVLAATVGTMASWVPLLPSGLGLVEAAIPAILHKFGAPLDDALAATLVYRAAGTLLPALVGGLAIAALRSHRDTLPSAAARGAG